MKRHLLAVAFGGLALAAMVAPAVASPAMRAEIGPSVAVAAAASAIHPADWVYRHGRREWDAPRWHYHPWHPRWHQRHWQHGHDHR